MTDNISRQAALDAIKREAMGWDMQMKPGNMPYEFYERAINALPATAVIEAGEHAAQERDDWVMIP